MLIRYYSKSYAKQICAKVSIWTNTLLLLVKYKEQLYRIIMLASLGMPVWAQNFETNSISNYVKQLVCVINVRTQIQLWYKLFIEDRGIDYYSDKSYQGT